MIIAPATSFKSRIKRIAELSTTVPNKMFERATDPNVLTSEELVNFFSSDPENMFIVATGNGDVFLIHSIKELGNNIRQTESKIVGLQGLGSTASPFIVDSEHFSATDVVLVPDINHILACDSVQALKNLPIPEEVEEGVSYITFAKHALPGPIDVLAILAMDHDKRSCPFEIIMAIMNSRRAQDIDNDLNHSNRLIHWLWSAGTGQIAKFGYNINNDDPDAQDYTKKRIAECILPSVNAGDLSSPFPMSGDQLTALGVSLSNLAESNNTTNQLNAMNFQRIVENDNKKKDRVKKHLDEDTLKIILFGGTNDGETPLQDIPQEFRDMFNSETVGSFGKNLISFLTMQGCPNTSVHQSAITSIYGGNLFELEADAVKDLSQFSFTETKPMQASKKDEYMVLHLAELNGKPKTADEIKASMAQNAVVPADFYEMKENAVRFQKVIKLVFTDGSIFYTSYESFVKILENEKYLIRQLFTQDAHICTKIMYAAEIRIKLFWKNCLLAESVEDVDFSILDFIQIIHQLKLKSFHLELPMCFQIVGKPTPTSPKRQLDQQNQNQDGQQKRQVIKNEDVNPTFALKSDDEWKIFTGREAAEKRPAYGQKKMCHKWHCKGYCFSDCPNAASHVPSNKLTSEHTDGFKAWQEWCRKQAKVAKPSQ